MNNKIFLFILLVIILAVIALLGFQYWQTSEENTTLKEQILSFEQSGYILKEENTQLKLNIAALDNTNHEILALVDDLSEEISKFGGEQSRLQKQIEELKDKSSGICTKDNSCKFRTPGSAFRCNQDGKYNSRGDYWCECTIDCEVDIRS